MSSLREFAESVRSTLIDGRIEQSLAFVGVVGLIAAFVIVRWRFNVKKAQRLSDALAAYTEMELTQ